MDRKRRNNVEKLVRNGIDSAGTNWSFGIASGNTTVVDELCSKAPKPCASGWKRLTDTVKPRIFW